MVKRMKISPAETVAMLPQLSLAKMDPYEQELDLRYLHLGEETHQLAPMMHHLHSLIHLELMGNYIGSKGLIPLVKLLPKQPKLKYLGLAWNGLGDDACKYLARILQSLRQLEHLDLRYNRLGDKGMIQLSRSIKKGHGLQILDLQDNAICDAGAQALYDVCSRRLQLKLGCNSVPMHRLVQLDELMQARLDEEERLMREAQQRLNPGKGKKNRPGSQQSRQSKPPTPQSKGSKESKPTSSQQHRPSLGTLSEMS